jgi:hypothetical protein
LASDGRLWKKFVLLERGRRGEHRRIFICRVCKISEFLNFEIYFLF